MQQAKQTPQPILHGQCGLIRRKHSKDTSNLFNLTKAKQHIFIGATTIKKTVMTNCSQGGF